jgi:large subunit ribosomal protein L10
MPTQRQVESVADLTEKLDRAQVAVVTDYRGLTMAELSDLRKRLREANAELIVAKNTLTLLAAKATGRDAIEPLLAGPTAIAFAYDDVPKFVRAINDFNRGPRKIVVRGGVLGSALLKEDVLDQVANLPTRNELLAQILGGVSSPVSGVVGVIAAPVNDVFNAVNAAALSVLYALQGRIDQLQPEGQGA